MRRSFYSALLAMLLSSGARTEAIGQGYPIYSGQKPDIVHLWHRIADFAPVLRSVESARISPDGERIVSASKFGYNLMVWRVADGALLWEVKEYAEIECVVFSPDGRLFATGDENFFVKIWDAASGKVIKELEHDGALDGIAWSHDGATLAAGSEKGDIWLWNAQTFELITKMNVGSTVNSMDFTADDDFLLAGGNVQTPDPKTKTTRYDGFVKLIDLRSRRVVRDYKGPKGSVKSVRIAPNEKMIASAGFDNTVRLFDFASGALLKTFDEPLRVEAVEFTPDNQYLLCGGHQRAIRFYAMRDDYPLVLELPTPRTEYIDFSKDGRLLLTAHEDSGLISLYAFISSTHDTPGLYQQIEKDVLKNRDVHRPGD